MKIKEIREMTAKELASRKHELEHEAFNLRIQKQGGQLEKPHLLTAIRRDIARISTALTEKTKASAPVAK